MKTLKKYGVYATKGGKTFILFFYAEGGVLAHDHAAYCCNVEGFCMGRVFRVHEPDEQLFNSRAGQYIQVTEEA